MNKIKEDIEIPAEAVPEKKEKTAATPPAAKNIMRFLDGSFMTKENVVDLLPFLLFISGIGIFYIGNRYYSEKHVFKMNAISNELKELRSEYITTKSDLMFKSKQSEVAKAIAETGLKESVVPPKKIVVTREELNTGN
jgi:hypothetical protein